MPDELTTRDVFQQEDTRLSRVEEDLREFRTEVNARFDQINGRFDRAYQEIGGLRGEMNGRLDRVDQRFTWIYGLLVALLISVVGLVVSVAGLWLKG